MNKNTIGVTAASGQLGSAIVRAAAEVVGKENVIGLARTPSEAHTKRDELMKSLQGVDSLLLVSATGQRTTKAIFPFPPFMTTKAGQTIPSN